MIFFWENYFYGNKQRLKFGVAKLPNVFIRLSSIPDNSSMLCASFKF